MNTQMFKQVIKRMKWMKEVSLIYLFIYFYHIDQF